MLSCSAACGSVGTPSGTPNQPFVTYSQTMAEIESAGLRGLGRGLVALLGVIWLASFVLHLGDLFAGRVAWVPIYVETKAEASPLIVSGFWSGGPAWLDS